MHWIFIAVNLFTASSPFLLNLCCYQWKELLSVRTTDATPCLLIKGPLNEALLQMNGFYPAEYKNRKNRSTSSLIKHRFSDGLQMVADCPVCMETVGNIVHAQHAHSFLEMHQLAIFALLCWFPVSRVKVTEMMWRTQLTSNVSAMCYLMVLGDVVGAGVWVQYSPKRAL